MSEKGKLQLRACNDPLRIHQGIQWVSSYASSQHAGVRFKNPYFSLINLKTAIIPSTKSTICASHIVMMVFSELMLFLGIARSYFVNRIMKSAKNPCGSKCPETRCFNKCIWHLSASLRHYCWLTYTVTFWIVETFNPDTEVFHRPWQWLTGDCCGRHKASLACWRKEAEKGKRFQSFIFLAVQAASPSRPSPLYYIYTTNSPFKKVHLKHCSLYQSSSEAHWGPCCSNVS